MTSAEAGAGAGAASESGSGGLPPIGVVGTGLIGTSIALAAARLGHPVRGHDGDPETMTRAALRAGFEPARSIDGCARGAAFVFVCTPVPAIAEAAVACLSADPNALVTDVGSVKSHLVLEVEGRLGEESASRFVGGHPMAGSERTGPDAASASLFDGAAWILTPGRSRAGEEAVVLLSAWIRRIGARPMVMDAERHDRLVAVVSHLPQVVSSALMALAAREHALDPDLLDLSAGGFRDLTRLAASSPPLWTDILRTNREAVLPAMSRLVEALAEIRHALEDDSPSELERMLDEARAARLALGTKPQVRAGVAVLQVAIPDRPGVLAHITGALAASDVNIEDLQIVHSAEGGRGTAHLTVAAELADAASGALASSGFDPVRLA